MADDPVKDELDRAHLHDLCRAAHRGQIRFTRFLEPPHQAEAVRCAKEEGVEAAFFGGYEGAERAVAAFYEGEPPESWPVECLRADWSAAFSKVQHRDLLGALMGLGIERSLMGDIVVGEGSAYLFAIESVAPLILSELTSAGRAKLSVRRAEGEALPYEAGVSIRDTVSTMRLDALIAAGFSLGRAEAQEVIRRGLVKLNHLPEARTDARIRAGDLISVRGQGRLRVDEEQGPTKKGRLGVKMTRFGAR
jgi:RNA-binding protein YlmH